MNDSPESGLRRVLTTPRTRLVPFQTERVRELTEVFRDPAVRRYLLDGEVVDTSWAEAEVAESDRRFAETGAGLWAMFHPAASDSIVGFAGFRPFFEPARLQLLYGLLPALWGQGIATEVASALTAHAFRVLDFARVEAAVDVPNAASARVLEKIGFRGADLEPQSAATAFYALDRSEWLSNSEARGS